MATRCERNPRGPSSADRAASGNRVCLLSGAATALLGLVETQRDGAAERVGVSLVVDVDRGSARRPYASCPVTEAVLINCFPLQGHILATDQLPVSVDGHRAEMRPAPTGGVLGIDDPPPLLGVSFAHDSFDGHARHHHRCRSRYNRRCCRAPGEDLACRLSTRWTLGRCSLRSTTETRRLARCLASISSVADRGYAEAHQTVTTYPAFRPRRDQVVVSQTPGSVRPRRQTVR